MARYLEARRKGDGLEAAIREAHEDTWLATLTACVAASAAYASLTITEFRGFRDFGLIGAVGMLLCWLATYWTMPAILVVSERIRRSSLRPIALVAALAGHAFETRGEERSAGHSLGSCSGRRGPSSSRVSVSRSSGPWPSSATRGLTRWSTT